MKEIEIPASTTEIIYSQLYKKVIRKRKNKDMYIIELSYDKDLFRNHLTLEKKIKFNRHCKIHRASICTPLRSVYNAIANKADPKVYMIDIEISKNHSYIIGYNKTEKGPLDYVRTEIMKIKGATIKSIEIEEDRKLLDPTKDILQDTIDWYVEDILKANDTIIEQQNKKAKIEKELEELIKDFSDEEKLKIKLRLM